MNVNEANIAGSLCKSSIDTLAYNFDKELRLTDGFAPGQQIKVRVAKTSDSLDWDGDTWTPLDGTIKEFTAQSHTWILQVMSLGTRFADWSLTGYGGNPTLNKSYTRADIYYNERLIKAGSAIHVTCQITINNYDQSTLGSSLYYGIQLWREYLDSDGTEITDNSNYEGILSPIQKALTEKFGDFTTHCFTSADNCVIPVDEWVSVKSDVTETYAYLTCSKKVSTGSIVLKNFVIDVSEPYHYQCVPHNALYFYETEVKQVLGKTGTSGGFGSIDINTPSVNSSVDDEGNTLLEHGLISNMYATSPKEPAPNDPSATYGYFAGYSALAPGNNYPRNDTIRIITFANQMRNIDSKYSNRIIVHVPPKDGVTMDADQLSDSTITSSGALWSKWFSPLSDSDYDIFVRYTYPIHPSMAWSSFVAGGTYKVAMWLELADDVALTSASIGYFQINGETSTDVIADALNTRWQEVSKLYNNPTNPQSFPNKAYYIETTVTLPSSLPSGNFRLYISTYYFASGKFRFTIPAITLIG